MRRKDPLPVPQLAVPVQVVEMMYTLALKSGSEKDLAVADLAILAFYYLLRVGEYTKPKFVTVNGEKKKATRTVQFRLRDVGFFAKDTLINFWELTGQKLLDSLLHCTGGVLKITNQKNGRMGQTIFHEAIEDKLDGPTQALARRVHHIISNGGTQDSLLCQYKSDPSQDEWEFITSRDIVAALRTSVKACGLDKKGIDPDLVAAHSLRAGGAMAMKLQGIADTIIMKHGRWSGLTFLMYIHNQIAHISANLSKTMSTHVPFVNIGNIRLP